MYKPGQIIKINQNKLFFAVDSFGPHKIIELKVGQFITVLYIENQNLYCFQLYALSENNKITVQVPISWMNIWFEVLNV